jgi:hypothetical protein
MSSDKNETVASVVASVDNGLQEFARRAGAAHGRQVIKPDVSSPQYDRLAGIVTMSIDNVNPAPDLGALMDCINGSLAASGFGRGLLRTDCGGTGDVGYVLSVKIPTTASIVPASTQRIQIAKPARSCCGTACRIVCRCCCAIFVVSTLVVIAAVILSGTSDRVTVVQI